MGNLHYKRTEETLFSAVGADILALHIPNGRCYGMEEVTAAVWNLLDKPRSLESICNRLMEQYDVGSTECQADVARLLDLFRAEGLVETVAGTGDGKW